VEKQAKEAIDAIVARKDAKTVNENIGKLRALVRRPPCLWPSWPSAGMGSPAWRRSPWI